MQVFDGNGKFETQWHNMHRPCGICMCGAGTSNFYIGELGPGQPVNMKMPNIGPRVSIVSNKGETIARIGHLGPGTQPDQFLAPHGLAVDRHGDIYVGEVSFTNQRNMGNPVGPETVTLRKLVKVKN